MAYDFDGTADYMEGAITALNVPLTLSCWMNSDVTNAAKILLAVAAGSILSGSTASQSLSIRTTAAAQVQAVTAAGNGSNNSQSAGTFTANTWNHVVGRFASTSSRIVYLNGTKATESTITRATGGTLSNLLIARGSGGTYFPSAPFNGRLAELAVWSVALDDDEIISLYDGVKPTSIRPQSLEYYVPIVRNINDPVGGISLTSTSPTVSAHTRRYG